MTRLEAETSGEDVTPPHTIPAQPGPGGPPARGLAANISALAASQAITWCMTLLWAVVVPRMIGPSQLGLLVGAIAVTAIFGVLLGLPTKDFLTREMVARSAEAPTLLGSALLLRLCLVPVFLMGVSLYAATASLPPTGTVVLWLCAGTMLCTMLTEPLLSAFQSTERMQYLAYNEVLGKTLLSIGGVALALAGVGVVGISWFGLGVSALLLLMCTRWARSLLSITVVFEVRRLTTLARASAPYWTFGVFFMIYLWIDSVLLALLQPAEVVGWYGVATRLFTTLMFLPVVLSTAWLPRLVAAFRHGPAQLHLAARAPLQIVVVLSVPLSTVVALTAHDVIALLYGEEYAGAATPLAVLAFCLPAMYLNIMLNQVLVAAGRPKAWACLMAAATVVNPGLNVLLVQLSAAHWGNGAIGAALALLITELLIVSGGMAIVGRHVVDRSTMKRFAKAGTAAVLMATAMVVVGRAEVSGIAGLLLLTLTGGTVFLGAAALLRLLSDEELVLLRGALRKLQVRPRRTSQGSPP